MYFRIEQADPTIPSPTPLFRTEPTAMQVSEARLAAIRINALKSRGPASSEGRLKSRMNACAHFLTAEVAVPGGDVEEIVRRVEALTAEMRPRTAAGAILIGQMARLFGPDGAGRRAGVGARGDENPARRRRLRRRAGRPGQSAVRRGWPMTPGPRSRKLKRMPEGVEKTGRGLVRPPRRLGDRGRLDLVLRPARASGQPGRPEVAARAKLAVRGAQPGDPGRLRGPRRRRRRRPGRFGPQAWARERLVEAINAEIAVLEAITPRSTSKRSQSTATRPAPAPCSTLRSRRPWRGGTKPSHVAGYVKALKEFRLVEAEFAAPTEASPTAPSPSPAVARMGSFRSMTPPAAPGAGPNLPGCPRGRRFPESGRSGTAARLRGTPSRRPVEGQTTGRNARKALAGPRGRTSCALNSALDVIAASRL